MMNRPKYKSIFDENLKSTLMFKRLDFYLARMHFLGIYNDTLFQPKFGSNMDQKMYS